MARSTPLRVLTDPWVEPGAVERPQVDVLVEGEAQGEDDPPLDGAAGDLRVADGRAERALEDGVATPDGSHVGVVEDVAVPEVAVGAEVEGDLVELDAGGAQHLHGLSHDLRTDAVAADHTDAMSHWMFSLTNERPPPEGDGRHAHAERFDVRYVMMSTAQIAVPGITDECRPALAWMSWLTGKSSPPPRTPG
jgi:hypothetical protein